MWSVNTRRFQRNHSNHCWDERGKAVPSISICPRNLTFIGSFSETNCVMSNAYLCIYCGNRLIAEKCVHATRRPVFIRILVENLLRSRSHEIYRGTQFCSAKVQLSLCEKDKENDRLREARFPNFHLLVCIVDHPGFDWRPIDAKEFSDSLSGCQSETLAIVENRRRNTRLSSIGNFALPPRVSSSAFSCFSVTDCPWDLN